MFDRQALGCSSNLMEYKHHYTCTARPHNSGSYHSEVECRCFRSVAACTCSRLAEECMYFHLVEEVEVCR